MIFSVLIQLNLNMRTLSKSVLNKILNCVTAMSLKIKMVSTRWARKEKMKMIHKTLKLHLCSNSDKHDHSLMIMMIISVLKRQIFLKIWKGVMKKIKVWFKYMNMLFKIPKIKIIIWIMRKRIIASNWVNKALVFHYNCTVLIIAHQFQENRRHQESL